MSYGCAAFQPHPSNPIPTPELLEDLRAGPALEITTEKEQVLGERAEVTGESQLCLPAQIKPLWFQKLPDNITQ